MMDNIESRYVITYFLRLLPSLIVWVVAIVIAGVHWKKHRAVSNLVILSSISQIVLVVANFCLRNYFYRNFSIQSPELADSFYWMSVWGFFATAWGAANWALLLAAAFTGRKN